MTDAVEGNFIPTRMDQNGLASRPDTWRSLQWLNYYRMLTGISLLSYLLLVDSSPFVGFGAPDLTLAVSLIYVLFSIASAFTIHSARPSLNVQVHSQILVDIGFIILVMHTSGGIISGYGMLLNIAIAGGAITVGGRTAIMFASAAALAILADQFYSHLTGSISVNYPQAGMHGISYFTTAILAHVLARRIRESEALARQRGQDLDKLATLNEHIIQQLDAGIIVVNVTGIIQQANRAAEKCLARGDSIKNRSLRELIPILDQQHVLWLGDHHHIPTTFTTAEGRDVCPHFIALGSDTQSGTLIRLEDIGATLLYAQQLKLASLGRLTASIAHEIRNPLGAISHAAQLLQEAKDIPRSEARLTQIIHAHSQRVNSIIENILQISRKGKHQPENFELRGWLTQSIDEYRQDHGLGPRELALSLGDDSPWIRADKSQLRQVLVNLIDNGLRHGDQKKESPLVEILLHNNIDGTSVIEVRDNGPGINSEDLTHIFEPFFTTRSAGTGLGLYLSKMLCEINLARLGYSNQNQQSRFLIHFSNADDRRK